MNYCRCDSEGRILDVAGRYGGGYFIPPGGVMTAICPECKLPLEQVTGTLIVEEVNDPVNHPKHYTSSPAKCSQCDHTIEQIDITRHMGFTLGNVIKYLWRFQGKNGLEDLKKAAWYINDAIKHYGGEK